MSNKKTNLKNKNGDVVSVDTTKVEELLKKGFTQIKSDKPKKKDKSTSTTSTETDK